MSALNSTHAFHPTPDLPIPSASIGYSTSEFTVDRPFTPSSPSSPSSPRNHTIKPTDNTGYLVSAWSSYVDTPSATSVTAYQSPSEIGDSSSTISPSSEEVNRGKRIPRPMNSWMLFRADWTARQKSRQKGNTSTRAAVEWRELSEAERAVWTHRAEMVKEEHARMYPEYKYRPNRRGHSGTSSTSTFTPLPIRTRGRPPQRIASSSLLPTLDGPLNGGRYLAASLGDQSRLPQPNSSSSSPPPSARPNYSVDRSKSSTFDVPMCIPPPPQSELVSEPALPAMPAIIAKPLKFAAPIPTYPILIPETPDILVTPQLGSDEIGFAGSSRFAYDAHQTSELEPSTTYTFQEQAS
ncbi:hypothetical protein FRB90_006043, partial [Tulasnella sp. 427]